MVDVQLPPSLHMFKITLAGSRGTWKLILATLTLFTHHIVRVGVQSIR
jgi:hypothetical protein